jgi:phage terminase large subunit-like protein
VSAEAGRRGWIAQFAAALAALPDEEVRAELRRLTPRFRREINAWWPLWSHPGQRPPPGDWRVWMIRAGRGFGKTRAGAEWVSQVAREQPGARIALVAATLHDARRVMVEGESGLLAVAQQGERLRWRSTTGELEFPSGAHAYVYSAETPDVLRGPQHHAAWCDELGKWRRGNAVWNNLMMGMRLGDAPRTLVTTTPAPTPLMRHVGKVTGLVETRGRTDDNVHLPEAYLQMMREAYAGTRLGRQELNGELIEDVAGALWSRALIERCRTEAAPEIVRVVVGVDPPAGTLDGDAADACGIVAVALGRDGVAYVLEDASVAATSPEQWARGVAACAARHRADRVVAEANQGGTMVRSVLLAADAGLPVELVHASRGKAARAEPVSMLYEGGKVRHAGVFLALEDELCRRRLWRAGAIARSRRRAGVGGGGADAGRAARAGGAQVGVRRGALHGSAWPEWWGVPVDEACVGSGASTSLCTSGPGK